MPKIIDVAMFNNEIEMLDLRINILNDIVDAFYIIQADKTHQGDDKGCLQSYPDDRVHLITIRFPDGLDNWGRENYQRQYKVDLSEYSHDDMVMISDIDEVPDPVKLKIIRDELWDPQYYYAFEQTMHQYYLNNVNTTEQWSGTRALSISNYNYIDLQSLRGDWGIINYHPIMVQDAGWHWSFLGGKDLVRKKIISYAHSEFNHDGVLNSIEDNINNNADIFGRNNVLEVVPIDERYPEYIRNNQHILKHLIKGL